MEEARPARLRPRFTIGAEDFFVQIGASNSILFGIVSASSNAGAAPPLSSVPGALRSTSPSVRHMRNFRLSLFQAGLVGPLGPTRQRQQRPDHLLVLVHRGTPATSRTPFRRARKPVGRPSERTDVFHPLLFPDRVESLSRCNSAQRGLDLPDVILGFVTAGPNPGFMLNRFSTTGPRLEQDRSHG